MSTVTFGAFPGVRASLTPGGISGIQVGREQVLVLFGHGDNDVGTADPNTPTGIRTRVDAREQFGATSELALSIEDALTNGANIDFVYGVMLAETEVLGDTGAGAAGDATNLGDGSGRLSNSPIREDVSLITVRNTTNDTEETPVFRYESPPDPSGLDANEVAINPNTGEFEAGDTDSYEVDYQYGDWQAALDSADTTIQYNETGIYCTLSDAESVAQQLEAKVDELRPQWQLVKGVSGAEPNLTSSDGEAIIDTSSYGDDIDNDAVFLAGPVRLANTTTRMRSVLGGIAGQLAGHSIINPVYGDEILGYQSLAQSLTRSERQDLRSDLVRVIPVEDNRRGAGGISLADNISTSTATGWTRDFHRIRIVDQVLMIGNELGEQARTNLMSDTLLTSIEEDYLASLEDLVNIGVLESSRPETLTNNNLQSSDDDRNPDTTSDGRINQDSAQQETKYFVDVSRSASDTVAISVGFAPVGIARNVDETIIVSE